eukprot:6768765-Heterocapsa_arctica.AAC.1
MVPDDRQGQCGTYGATGERRFPQGQGDHPHGAGAGHPEVLFRRDHERISWTLGGEENTGLQFQPEQAQPVRM